MIKERMQQLREKMKEQGIAAYLVVTDDFHGSEYVGSYFKCREYISGFTGSAGSVLVTDKTAGLWTDGRYFLQAEKQLSGTGIELFRSGEEGVPELLDYLREQLEPGQCVAFDGRTISDQYATEITAAVAEKNVRINSGVDLIGDIWSERPALSHQPAFALALAYAGVSRQDKLQAVKDSLVDAGADYLILTSLDDIAWLLNIRGNDVAYSPVVLCYAIIGREHSYLFAQADSFSAALAKQLQADQLQLAEYEQFYSFIKQLPLDTTVIVDRQSVSRAVMESVPKSVSVVAKTNPTLLLKAIKNETEIQNIRRAHHKDGVAVTKFIYWLKQQAGQVPLSECSVAEQLEMFRAQQEHYRGPSFAPIFAYQEHSAVIHYSATAASDKEIGAQGLLLMDTGGHYLEGSTDITRTVSLGTVTQQQKQHYTAVLKGNLRLAAAKFLHGCRGINLDYLARQSLWELGLDYQHGTGHGVGYLLNVHEGPNSIRWKLSEPMESNAVLEAGMVTSNEPGVYLPGEYGIRLENLMLCKRTDKTKYGQFMEFETLTLVPFDLDCVAVADLSELDKALLNNYHKRVRQALLPHLNEAEGAWLRESTRAI